MTRFSTRSHPRTYADLRYVYAVLSRRRGGISLGVNLNPDKVCNFGCVYCQVDRTAPGHRNEVDARRVLEELDHVLALAAEGRLRELPGFDDPALGTPALLDVSFSGDGEPTTARQFPELVQEALARVAALGLEIPVIVFTNLTRSGAPKVAAALAALLDAGGQVWAKLDAGTDAGFLRWDGVALSAARIAGHLGTLSRHPKAASGLVVQSMLCRDARGPIPEAELHAMATILRAIAESGGHIAEVQAYTVARPTPDARVAALSAEELEARAAILRSEQPFPVRTFGAGSG